VRNETFQIFIKFLFKKLFIFFPLISISLPSGRKNDQLQNAKQDVVRVLVPFTLKFLNVEPYWKL